MSIQRRIFQSRIKLDEVDVNGGVSPSQPVPVINLEPDPGPHPEPWTQQQKCDYLEWEYEQAKRMVDLWNNHHIPKAIKAYQDRDCGKYPGLGNLAPGSEESIQWCKDSGCEWVYYIGDDGQPARRKAKDPWGKGGQCYECMNDRMNKRKKECDKLKKKIEDLEARRDELQQDEEDALNNWYDCLDELENEASTKKPIKQPESKPTNGIVSPVIPKNDGGIGDIV